MDSVTAKQFLISRVIEESELEHIALSEVERKMLHFTEVHPSLPDIYDVNAEFERNYDSDEYETKIAGLLKNARDRDRKPSPGREQDWKDAIDALRKEDDYILVMTDQAFGPSSSETVRRQKIWAYVFMGIVFALYLAWKILRER